jgi:hypothetical protein
VVSWTQLKSLLTIEERNKFLNYAYSGNNSEIVDVDIENDIVTSFIVNTFLRIYRIESIVKNNGQGFITRILGAFNQGTDYLKSLFGEVSTKATGLNSDDSMWASASVLNTSKLLSLIV